MKFRTFHNRVRAQEFVLSSVEVKEAIEAYVARRSGAFYPNVPAGARIDVEIEIDGESHDEAVRLTRRYTYNDEAPEAADTIRASDAVAKGTPPHGSSE